MTSGRILCANPLVVIYDDFADQAELEELQSVDFGEFQRAGVLKSGVKTVDDSRTNTQALVDQWSHPVLAGICERVSSVVRIPPENCEHAKLLNYLPGQKFDSHHDAYDDFMPDAVLELMAGGQRLFTTILYLNEVEEGGETDFPRLRVSVRPVPGRLLLFANTLPGQTERHPHSLHAGTPVIKGEKRVLSLWWRERMFHVPREYPEESGPVTTV